MLHAWYKSEKIKLTSYSFILICFGVYSLYMFKILMFGNIFMGDCCDFIFMYDHYNDLC